MKSTIIREFFWLRCENYYAIFGRASVLAQRLFGPAHVGGCRNTRTAEWVFMKIDIGKFY